MLVAFAMSTMVGCTGPRQARSDPFQEAGSNSQGSSDDTRGIHIDIDRARLGLDHALQVRRSRNDVPHELHDGDTVMTGDRIRVSVQTSEDAYLYLAFCVHHVLTVYPSQAGIRTVAGQLMVVPPGSAELVIDGEPGLEVLYVILSRAEISVADPRLAAALAAKPPHDTPMDCRSLDVTLAKPSSKTGPPRAPTPSSTNVVRGEPVHKKPRQPPHAAIGNGPSSSARAHTPGSGSDSSGMHRNLTLAEAVPPPPPDPGFERYPGNIRSLPPTSAPLPAPPPPPPPDPDFERNPGIVVWYRVDGVPGPQDVVAADDDGIVVVRHAFRHVLEAPSP